MTVYSDAAGNKYLGDCRWGNHDINYPTTEYPISFDNPKTSTEYLADCTALFADVNYPRREVSGSYPLTSANNATTWIVSPVGELDTVNNYFRFGIIRSTAREGSTINNLIEVASGGLSNFYGYSDKLFHYSLCASSKSMAQVQWVPSGNRSNLDNAFFNYWGKLENINSNFNYYSQDFITSCVSLAAMTGNNTMVNVAAQHRIVNTTKALLTTGRAAYTISCSDGQTPGTQWATDMWVFDNNATLGYPVIGRVPNMLLGIGTYTYLKPVKIEGSVFPDNGSPWYLPVGVFAGKTLLMRCYSSI